MTQIAVTDGTRSSTKNKKTKTAVKVGTGIITKKRKT
jgi:hypothetical protein